MIMLLAMLAGGALQGDGAQPQATKVVDKNEIVCRYRATPTGSVQKVCATRSEMKRQEIELHRAVLEHQMRSYSSPVR